MKRAHTEGSHLNDLPRQKVQGNRKEKVGDFECLTLLAIKALGPHAYGAEIGRYLTQKLHKNFAMAQVYVALSRLEDKGFLSSNFTDYEPRQGGRRKRLYHIEASGIRVLNDKLAAFNAVTGAQLMEA